MYKKFNLAKPKKYTDKRTGEEKTFWQTIGTMTEFEKEDGKVSRILEIPAIGLECSVFPAEPREPRGEQSGQGGYSKPAVHSEIEGAADEINVKDIPF